MRYPTVGQYLDCLAQPEGLFRTLSEVVPLRDLYGELLFRVGNYSVIFRLPGDRALKCYTRQAERLKEVYHYVEQLHEPFLVKGELLEREIYVYDEAGRGCYYPVVCMEWVSGQVLGREVDRLSRAADKEALAELTSRFTQFALWLLKQPFAHGDIKHDNILITPQGELRLIDLDGLFRPQDAGACCALIGSPAYQHPARDEHFFNKHIDDYPLALMVLSLHALVQQPELFARYNDRENLILNAAAVNVGRSELFERLMKEWAVRGERELYALGEALRGQTPQIAGLVELLEAVAGVYAPSEILAASGASQACTIVCLGDVWHGMDEYGKSHFVCADYDQVDDFRDARARVCRDGLYGFIDVHGREVVPPSYQFVTAFREGYAAFRRAEKWGYLDVQGNEVIAQRYDVALRFRQGRAAVEIDGRRFEIDPQGRELEPQM